MVKVTPATFATLAQHPNIVGCKLSHGDVSQLTQIALDPALGDADRFRVFTGLGQQLLPVMSVGCGGAIDGSAGFFPRSLVRLFALSSRQAAAPPLSDGEREERARLQYRVSCMAEMVVRHGVPGIKEATRRLRGFGGGGGGGGLRLPLAGGLPGGDAEWARWKGVLDDMEELETALYK
ncbi:hypothetical protein V2A60_009418 [Cordyceps javanica]